MEELFKWRTSLRIRSCFSCGNHQSSWILLTTTRAKLALWAPFPMIGWSEEILEYLQITPRMGMGGTQDHEILKCCGSLDIQIEPWQSYRNAPQILFQGNLYCHVHHLWAGARTLWVLTVQFTISNSLTQMPAPVCPWHYSLTLGKPLSPDCVNLLIAPWQVLIFLVFFWNGDVVDSGFAQPCASDSPSEKWR